MGAFFLFLIALVWFLTQQSVNAVRKTNVRADMDTYHNYQQRFTSDSLEKRYEQELEKDRTKAVEAALRITQGYPTWDKLREFMKENERACFYSASGHESMIAAQMAEDGYLPSMWDYMPHSYFHVSPEKEADQYGIDINMLNVEYLFAIEDQLRKRDDSIVLVAVEEADSTHNCFYTARTYVYRHGPIFGVRELRWSFEIGRKQLNSLDTGRPISVF